jgi:hypothetical protein
MPWHVGQRLMILLPIITVTIAEDVTVELEKAVSILHERGVPHGEIEDLGDMGICVLAFRDPDNIQLELSAPKN